MAEPKFSAGQSVYDDHNKRPGQVVEVFENMGGFGVHAYAVRHWAEVGGQFLLRETTLREFSVTR